MNTANIYWIPIVLPQIVPFDFGEEEINSMDMVSASCTVNKGDLPLKITWMRNNQSIYSNDGISISRTNQRISILSIESVRDRHIGQYVCIAENSAGSVNYTASLWVNGTKLQRTTPSIIRFMMYCGVEYVAALFIWIFVAIFFAVFSRYFHWSFFRNMDWICWKEFQFHRICIPIN